MLLTADEVAKELRVNKTTVLRLLRKGSLKGFKTTSGNTARWLISKEDLDEYVEQRKAHIVQVSR